jgi:hypothetical protein
MPKSTKATMQSFAVGGERSCTSCCLVLPFARFSRSSRDSLGIRAQCKACVSANSKAFYARDLKRQRERSKNYHARNAEKNRIRLRRWRKANPAKAAAIAKSWKERNPEKKQAITRRSYERKMASPQGRLENSTKAVVSASLKPGVKNGRQTFSLLGYSVDKLRRHLEARFLPGMSWKNYGKFGWHVDHIVPLSAFNYDAPEHADFKRAWALANLRPLWARDNWSKHAKLTAPFQPSLAL